MLPRALFIARPVRVRLSVIATSKEIAGDLVGDVYFVGELVPGLGQIQQNVLYRRIAHLGCQLSQASGLVAA
jgi:hypothetical protein